MQPDTDTRATARKPLRDVRGFWRVLLAVVAPLPMLGMGIHYILSPVDGGESFEATVAAYAAHEQAAGAIRWFALPFLVGLIPATFAVAWVARRGAPMLTTAGALLALLGDLAGFPLIRGGDDLAYLTATRHFDVATASRIQNALEENRVMRPNCASWRSFHSPRSAGLIRPSGDTAVASTMIRPAPPTAREPRWVRCQSVGTPCSGPSTAALYWHIGDIQTRLGMVRLRRVRGSNNALTPRSSLIGTLVR